MQQGCWTGAHDRCIGCASAPGPIHPALRIGQGSVDLVNQWLITAQGRFLRLTYSITSSALARSVDGSSSAIFCAALVLMESRKLVG